ncbi:magnesium transporter CorA family protein [Enterococcus sp. 669A]|uniref:Magnesium transporter CorA family protein n=1 Tax=Candidatus Enterococcus moelleringii TaxID=2815325 RepID=A0ABS3L4X6_9ENTE|nr:magnesium transporter CorA family protein [Enterococcus sp. 669A]MBO1304676.1 magnesium transporter CorA family protein [Enterococcus sp. 669A]
MLEQSTITTGEKTREWLSITAPTEEEILSYAAKFDLPKDVFTLHPFTEEVSRIEILDSDKLGQCVSLVLISYQVEQDVSDSVEGALLPISFLFSEDRVITVASDTYELLKMQRMFEACEGDAAQFIIAYILYTYHNYLLALNKQKRMIDEVNEASKNSTEKDNLILLRDIEKNLVYLEHTLDDQKQTTDLILADERIISQISKEALNDVRISCRRVEKLVHLYRGLVDSTSGMVSALMDNTLNHLMKYLDSAALIISIPTLIFSLWGINTGGLLWKDSILGSLSVVLLALVLTIIGVILLRRKDFMD